MGCILTREYQDDMSMSEMFQIPVGCILTDLEIKSGDYWIQFQIPVGCILTLKDAINKYTEASFKSLWDVF